LIRKGLNGLGYKEYKTVEEADGLNLIHQLTVQGKGKFAFIKAHLDFVFVKQKQKQLLIKEIKSSAFIPSAPYESHIRQVSLQMWLLQQQYPNYKVKGSVVYHNWDNGESVDYDIEYSKPLVVSILKRAVLLWNCINANREPEPEIQMYCDKCPYKGNCPAFKFEAKLPKDLEAMVDKVIEAKAIEKEAKKIKKNFMSLLEASGLKGAKVGDTTLQIVSVKGKKVVPLQKLKKEHFEIYKQVVEETGSYSFLKIT